MNESKQQAKRVRRDGDTHAQAIYTETKDAKTEIDLQINSKQCVDLSLEEDKKWQTSPDGNLIFLIPHDFKKKLADQLDKISSSSLESNNINQTYSPSSSSSSSSSLEHKHASIDGNTITTNAASNLVKIAGFDLDFTLITTKTGNVRPKSSDDWMWYHDSVPSKLRSLSDNGFVIVIFTNQSGARDEGKKTVLQNKLESIVREVSVPIAVFMSAGSGYIRKPSVGVWEEAMKALEVPLTSINKDSTFYVGDAAGRHAGFKYDRHGKPFKKDFSDSDRAFAHNIQVHFMTPEEAFLSKDPPKQDEWGYLSVSISDVATEVKDELPTPRSHQEVVIFVGPPASGKSTLFKVAFEPAGYIWVNQDQLKTPAKCMKVYKDALASKKSVVIDKLNATVDQRSIFIEVAKSLGVPIRCVVFKTPFEVAQHLNKVRSIITKDRIGAIPDLVYHSYKKSLIEPTIAEGFAEVCTYVWRPMLEYVKLHEGYEHIEKYFFMKT